MVRPSAIFLAFPFYIFVGHFGILSFVVIVDCFWAGRQHCPMSENNITNMCLCLLLLVFTILSQNVFLILYLVDFISFFWAFSFPNIIDDNSCLKYCIITKLSQIMYLLIYTFWYVNNCRFSDLTAFTKNFHILLHI